MKKRLLAALMAGAMALTMTACGGSNSGSDDSNAASGNDSGSAGSYKVGIVQLVQHEALDAATQGFQDKLKELVEADGGSVEFDPQNASGESANCTTIVNGFVSAAMSLAGLFGLTLGAICLVVHLAGLDSFGISYLAPFSGVGGARALLRPRLVREPLRDPLLRPLDRRNQGGKR